MAVYKVSYNMLSQQGEELKKLAKLVDGYVDRINSVKGKLGDDKMLAQVRTNLGTLVTQLGETRAVMNTAGGLLSKTVESYSASETRQVKKVDSLKAHNRDFYKNPVVVASAGGAAAGAAAAAAPTIQYTDNSATFNYYAAAPAATPAASSAANAIPTSPAGTLRTGSPGVAQGGIPGGIGLAAGVGVAGGVVGAGLVEGALHLKQNKDKKQPSSSAKEKDDDLEVRLARARERVQRLNGHEDA